jgi:hypothetical protein
VIWSILKKDWVLLWPLAVLVTVIQIAYEWAVYKYGFFGASPLAQEMMRLLSPAWIIGVVALSVAVVYEDTVPGVDQDWLIRPLQRSDVLAAKMLFVLLTVYAPMLVLNVIHELALGFPAVPSLGDALYKEAYLFICLTVPVMAVASATRDMRDLVVLVAGLVVIYTASLWLASMLFGVEHCPTCDTSIAWLQHLLQHLGLLVGSAVVLGLQYYRRKTQLSRVLLAVGVVLLVVLQLPWNAAFALQSWMGAPLGSSPSDIRIAADPTDVAEGNRTAGAAQGNARRATRALLQGDVDTAIQSIKSARRAEAPVVLTVPLQISGLTHDEILVADHARFSLMDATGTVLYSGTSTERRAVPLIPELAEPHLVRQKLEVPAAVYKRVAARAVNLSIDYSLTIRAVVAEHRIPAVDGEVRSPEVGICQSNADASEAYIRCKQIGHAPNCHSAMLYAPDGRHNPRVLSCVSDYRPYLPGPLEIISFTGIDLPIRDSYGIGHYDVDLGDLPDSYIIMKVYEPGQHFRRTVVSRLQAAE